MRKSIFSSRWLRPAAVAMLASTLAACAVPAAQAPAVRPQAFAMGLAINDDGGVPQEALQQLNQMLRQQGRLSRQSLVITPFSERAIPVAVRVAEALRQAGAVQVDVQTQVDAMSQESALAQGWDLELRSEALALVPEECGLAAPGLNRYPWTSHPYWSTGPLGCATRHNLAQMVSDPRDLLQAKVLEAADGHVTAEAVRRYHEDDVKALVDIDFEE